VYVRLASLIKPEARAAAAHYFEQRRCHLQAMHDEVHAEIDRSSKKKSGGGRLHNRLNVLEEGQRLKSEKVLRLGQVLAALRGLQPAADVAGGSASLCGGDPPARSLGGGKCCCCCQMVGACLLHL